MPHDFENFPELANSQMDIYYWESPHKQITYSFNADVVKVHDGDTCTVRCNFRDFDFPVRMLDTNSPELNEEGGHEARDFLKGIIENEQVYIQINPQNRVGKWGRLLGTIIHRGLSINELMVQAGKATPFAQRNEGKIPNLEKELANAIKFR